MKSVILRRSAACTILVAAVGCDDDPFGGVPADVSGRWTYQATEMRGAQVTCATSDVVLSLRPSGGLRVDARFSGTAFSFNLECRQGERTATLIFSGGSEVLNGEIEDGVVAFDFADPDFIHTGTFAETSMGGTVATRLDLSGTPLVDVGIVNLIGEWEATKD